MKRQPQAGPAPEGVTEAILSFFRARPGLTVSGAELSSQLGISRTAIWKQIKNLRQLGYQIAAEPSRGYRLLAAPDLLIPAEIVAGLSLQRLGRPLFSYPEIESTNATAFKLAEAGAAEGTTVVAESQTRGKGRLGRSWASPPGVNLYCSVILRPSIQPLAAPQLTFLSVVAVARAIERLTDLTPRIKWPNDLLLRGQKIAGLLNEMSAETDTVNFIILGIGVNLNMRAEHFPADLRHPATSLLIETGSPVDRTVFTRYLLEELDRLYDRYLRLGYASIRQEWLERSAMAGAEVMISNPGTCWHGVVAGIDEYGALLVEKADGQVEQVLSGDVRLVDR
jgi:BirA family transcriptional regulator, biotin operon repressor / biotin---[acetyl-CoA-carboxylase] ligase